MLEDQLANFKKQLAAGGKGKKAKGKKKGKGKKGAKGKKAKPLPGAKLCGKSLLNGKHGLKALLPLPPATLVSRSPPVFLRPLPPFHLPPHTYLHLCGRHNASVEQGCVASLSPAFCFWRA